MPTTRMIPPIANDIPMITATVAPENIHYVMKEKQLYTPDGHNILQESL